MKLALVTHCVTRGDGQGRVNWELARHCLKRNVELSLLADEVDPLLIGEGARWLRVTPRFARPRLLRVGSFARAADHITNQRSERFDLTVANGFTLTRRHDVNVCHFVHDDWRRCAGHDGKTAGGWRGQYQRAYTNYNVLRERAVFAAARTVVAVSGKVRDELVVSGVPAQKIRLIPNGVDLEDFGPGTESREKLGLPQGRVLGLFVGDLRTGRKNLATVLHALKQVPALELVVIGSTDGSKFPRMAERLGLRGRVHFVGFRNDVASYMRACDLLLFPSHYEPFGLVLLEALACGLPVVTARSVGSSAIVSDACGRVIGHPTDVDALAAAMRELSANPALRQRLSQGARAAAEGHSWSAACEAYLKLFEEHLP